MRGQAVLRDISIVKRCTMMIGKHQKFRGNIVRDWTLACAHPRVSGGCTQATGPEFKPRWRSRCSDQDVVFVNSPCLLSCCFGGEDIFLVIPINERCLGPALINLCLANTRGNMDDVKLFNDNVLVQE